MLIGGNSSNQGNVMTFNSTTGISSQICINQWGMKEVFYKTACFTEVVFNSGPLASYRFYTHIHTHQDTHTTRHKHPDTHRVISWKFSKVDKVLNIFFNSQKNKNNFQIFLKKDLSKNVTPLKVVPPGNSLNQDGPFGELTKKCYLF
jgi:hypothetical protein